MRTRNLFTAIIVGVASLQIAFPADSPARLPEARAQHDQFGNTPLIRAVLSGDLAEMKRLVAQGADVNQANQKGTTPLMLAAGDFAKIKFLVEQGASVNARSAIGNTPLILAARAYGSARAVELLLKHRADVNATNVFGANAIISAAASGDLETVRILLGRGADVNSHCRANQEAVLWGGGRSPLMWAAIRGDVAMIDLLLKHGAKVNEQEGFGTALTQAAWMDRTAAAELLLKHGADVQAKERFSGFTALHWAAQSENGSDELTRLLLKHGANPNEEGGEPVDAYMGIPQTPVMLAQRRGDTEILRTLIAAGGKAVATSEKPAFHREIDSGFDTHALGLAIDKAIGPLQDTAVNSKKAYLAHASRQNCVSCHQQYSPLTAFAFAADSGRPVDQAAQGAVMEMVRQDNANLFQLMAETTFHPEPAHGIGYALLALAAQKEPSSDLTDAMVHHLLVIQGKDGQWFNNLLRAPIQTSDIGATALAVHAITQYGGPARQSEIRKSVARARQWLARVRPANNEEQVYRILGLAWAGEDPRNVRKLAGALRKEQRPDGGWAQLPKLPSDAYATGQALYALKMAGVNTSAPEFRAGLKYLLSTQRDDGTWLVARRAFPFQPTMNSGYSHGRDSWVSAAGASWATIAMSLALKEDSVRLSALRD